jgi:hypothetical protein
MYKKFLCIALFLIIPFFLLIGCPNSAEIERLKRQVEEFEENQPAVEEEEESTEEVKEEVREEEVKEESVEEALEDAEPFFTMNLSDEQRLQQDVSMVRNLEMKPAWELEDNRIGSALDLDNVFYETDAWGGGADLFPFHRAELGVKRMRLMMDSGDFPNVDWSMKQESTKLTPEKVATITDFADQGINVRLNLVFWDVEAQGKYRTSDYSRFSDEAEIERYLDYTRDTVRQLKGKVAYYELLNEPNVPAAAEIEHLRGTQQDVRLPDYINLIKQVVPVIKEEDPEAKVAVGAVGNIQVGWEGIGGMGYLFELLESDVMTLVDAVTFHPFYNITPQGDENDQYLVDAVDYTPIPSDKIQDYYDNYPEFIKTMHEIAADSGFKGELIADEVTYWFQRQIEDVPLHYPAPPFVFTERLAEKYYIRSIVSHLGMDVAIMGNVEHFNNPSIQYLCTLMAGHEAVEMPVKIEIDHDGPFAYCSFRYPDGDLMLAVWTDDVAIDENPGVQTTITFPGLIAQSVTGIDVLHGLEHELRFKIEGESTAISEILVKDYPILIRLKKPEMSDEYKESAGPGFHRLNR